MEIVYIVSDDEEGDEDDDEEDDEDDSSATSSPRRRRSAQVVKSPRCSGSALALVVLGLMRERSKNKAVIKDQIKAQWRGVRRRHFDLFLTSQPPPVGETGELVWGQSSGSSYWPAVIREGRGIRGLGALVRVEWYGQKTSSLVSVWRRRRSPDPGDARTRTRTGTFLLIPDQPEETGAVLCLRSAL